MNDFDRHELQARCHSARVLGQEAKKILACLEQLEASNEAESDDEAYEAENGGGGGFQDGNGGGFQGGNRPREPHIVPRREYGDSYGGQGQGAPGTAAVRSRAAVGTTAAMDKVRVRVRVALGTTAVRGTAAVTTVARDPPPGLRRPGFRLGPDVSPAGQRRFGAPPLEPHLFRRRRLPTSHRFVSAQAAVERSASAGWRLCLWRRRRTTLARRANGFEPSQAAGIERVHVSAADAKKSTTKTTPRLALAVPAARTGSLPLISRFV